MFSGRSKLKRKAECKNWKPCSNIIGKRTDRDTLGWTIGSFQNLKIQKIFGLHTLVVTSKNNVAAVILKRSNEQK